MFDTVQAAPSSRPTSRTETGRLALFLGEIGHGRMEIVARDHGLDVAWASTLADARSILDQNAVEIVVMGPLASGQIDFSACLDLSRLRNAPIMVMPARDDATDRILALELGADDCVPTDCCDRELAARLKVLTRRAASREPLATSDEVRFAGWRLNRTTGEMEHDNGATCILTRMELIILKLFLANIGRVLTREDIQTAIGQVGSQYVRSADVSVFRLRKKLNAGDAEIIQTVRSVGYVMGQLKTPR